MTRPLLLLTVLLRIVVLSPDGKPVHDAAVFCGSELNLTDSAGVWICDVEPGPLLVRVSAPTFQPWEGSIRVSERGARLTVRLKH